MIRAWNDPAFVIFAHLRGLRIRLSPISKARAQTLDKVIIDAELVAGASFWPETKIFLAKTGSIQKLGLCQNFFCAGFDFSENDVWCERGWKERGAEYNFRQLQLQTNDICCPQRLLLRLCEG